MNVKRMLSCVDAPIAELVAFNLCLCSDLAMIKTQKELADDPLGT
jgi:hypothetical protein